MTENQIILTHMVLLKFLLLFPVLLLVGCFTDAATRLAYDIEAGAARIGKVNGDKFIIEHRAPSKAGECQGSYKVQLDKVGAIIVWCMDDTGADVVSSHSTSYHARFVDTPRTYILDKQAGETLLIELERRGGRAVIVEVK
jgi:hypothetical protein